MKRFLIRAGAKTGRFFWSWGFLKFVLWAVTLVILFYVEEDWRGARAWAATKAKWEARGVSFDPNSYIPPPVPDAENLAALPLFKLVPDPENESTLIPAALEKALRHDPNHRSLSSPVLEYDWTEGGLPHFDKLDHDIAAYYTQIFATTPASNDPLVQFEAIYPFIAELNSAAATRPFFRLAKDYTSQPSSSRLLWLSTSQIGITQKLKIHAMLALHENRPEVALTDIRTMVKMSAGISREPTLVSGLVSIGLCAITTTVVNYGLAVHAWNDAQLAEIQSAFGTLDPLANYQHVMRGEFVTYSLPAIKFYKEQRPPSQKVFHLSGSSLTEDDDSPAFWVLPNGWLDQTLCLTANNMFGAVARVDPKAHRVYVDPAEQAVKHLNDLKGSWAIFAPWNILFYAVAGPILSAQEQFSHEQIYIDQVRIACALERYRFVHGSYPRSLDALVPTNIDTLPCDPINGQPYHYRVRPDGTFLLYSVGWNQKDDGGKLFLTREGSIDNQQGDWVWPTPQVAASK